MEIQSWKLNINDREYQANASPDTPLLWVLRDALKLRGTKFGCGKGLCGACTVHLDGVATRSCVLPVSALADKKIHTIESLSPNQLSILQEVWIEHQVAQCGYCQSGQLMSATALLATNKSPTDADIDSAMSGNICRCGTYTRIRAAIKSAAIKIHPVSTKAAS